ncbi:hypothetical protein HS7_00700 [Sulfolobales archaeon HS-7]|nr:hypothetical protein HS7_00700 [Sulfolobales archaeon HS-7]
MEEKKGEIINDCFNTWVRILEMTEKEIKGKDSKGEK